METLYLFLGTNILRKSKNEYNGCVFDTTRLSLTIKINKGNHRISNISFTTENYTKKSLLL